MGEPNDRVHAIAWIDLLGFGKRMEDESLANVLKSLHSWRYFFNWDTSTLGVVAPIAPQVAFFQDTIVLWMPDASFDSVDSLVAATEYVFSTLALHGTPCRASIAAGTLYDSNKDPNAPEGTYFLLGSAISRAAQVEKGAAWVGIAFHPELEAHLEHGAWQELVDKWAPGGRICQYDVLYGDGRDSSACQLWTLNWAHSLRWQVAEDILDNKWKGYVPEKAKAKRDNTLTYLNWWHEKFESGNHRVSFYDVVVGTAKKPAWANKG